MLHRLAESILYIDSWALISLKIPLRAFYSVQLCMSYYSALPYYSACPTTVHVLLQCMSYTTVHALVHALLQCMPYYSTCPTSVHAQLQCMSYNTVCPILQCLPYHSACPLGWNDFNTLPVRNQNWKIYFILIHIWKKRFLVFLSRFMRVRLHKNVRMTQNYFFHYILIKVSKNAEFDADFKSVKKDVKSSYKKVISRKM